MPDSNRPRLGVLVSSTHDNDGLRFYRLLTSLLLVLSGVMAGYLLAKSQILEQRSLSNEPRTTIVTPSTPQTGTLAEPAQLSENKAPDVLVAKRTNPLAADFMQQPLDFSNLYALYNVKPLDTTSDVTYNSLRMLNIAPCDKQAIYKLTEDVGKIDPLWAGETLLGFGMHCGKAAEGDLRHAGSFFLRVSAFKQAIDAENAAERYDAADANVFFFRGKAYDGLEQLDDALKDYTRAYALVGPQTVSHELLWNMVSIYRKTSRPCDASNLLREYIESHPNANTNQAQTIRAELSDNCP